MRVRSSIAVASAESMHEVPNMGLRARDHCFAGTSVT